MKKFAIVEDNKVINIAVALNALKPNWVHIDGRGVSINDSYKNGVFTSPTPEPAPEPPEQELIDIIITAVAGAIEHNSALTHITCYEETDLIVTGTLAIPDRVFSMPIKRDDGRLFLFEVAVVNGRFDAVLNFPTTGQFTYTDIEANHDLPAPTFNVLPIRIDVRRKLNS